RRGPTRAPPAEHDAHDLSVEGHRELLRRRRRRGGEPGRRLVLSRAEGGGGADQGPCRLLARRDGGGLTSNAREIRSGVSPDALREPALVLAAAGIEHRVELAPEGWRLLVAGEDGERAVATLAAYDRERRPVRLDVPAEYGGSY